MKHFSFFKLMAPAMLLLSTLPSGATATTRGEVPDFPDDIDVRLKVDYNANKLEFACIKCCNEYWQSVVDDVDRESDGYIHLRDIPGEYTFVATFNHKDHDGVTIVIQEKIMVEENMSPILFDAYTATEKITFEGLTSLGLPFEGEIVNNGVQVQDGEIYTGYGQTQLFHQQYGEIGTFSFFLAAIEEDGKITYGPQEGNIYLNPLGEDTELAMVQTRFGRSSAGMEFLKLQAVGMGTQTVTNNPGDYLCLHNNFSEHAYGNQNMATNPAVVATESCGFVPIWKGHIEPHICLNAQYSELQPNMDTIYLCSPPSEDPDCDFTIIPLYGTFDDFGNSNFYDMGTGVFLPLMLDNGDGRFRVLDNAAANGFFQDSWTTSQETPYANIDAFNPHLEYYIENGSTEVWGNSVPITLASIGYRHNTDSELRFAYIGRKGDNRYIDNHNCEFKMTGDGEVISTRPYWTSGDYQDWRLEGGDFRSTRAEYVIELTNNNIIVDGLQGYNKTKIYYDTNMTSGNPPALRSLQFRDGDGNITDRFASFDDAIVEFYAGDFEMGEDYDHGRYYFFNYNLLNDAIIEYAPYQSEEWHSLYPEEIPDLFAEVAYGALYRAPLSDVTARSENGWYDVRIKLYDTNDNYQIQTLSPAFKLEDLSSIRSVASADDFIGEEVEIFTTSGLKIYSGIYNDVKNTGLPAGIYIVKPMKTFSGTGDSSATTSYKNVYKLTIH